MRVRGMSMCVCIYACVSVKMGVCVHAHVCVQACVCLHVCALRAACPFLAHHKHAQLGGAHAACSLPYPGATRACLQQPERVATCRTKRRVGQAGGQGDSLRACQGPVGSWAWAQQHKQVRKADTGTNRSGSGCWLGAAAHAACSPPPLLPASPSSS